MNTKIISNVDILPRKDQTKFINKLSKIFNVITYILKFTTFLLDSKKVQLILLKIISSFK